MIFTPDQERWAEALMIERLHGDGALDWVERRIDALAAAGDAEGVQRFQDIAAGLEELRRGTGALPS